MSRRSQEAALVARYGRPMAELLREGLAAHGSRKALAAAWGVHPSQITRWLAKFGLAATLAVVDTHSS